MATLGLVPPQTGRVEKVAEKVVCGSFVGPPLGHFFDSKSSINCQKVVARTTLTNIVRKVLHKRSLGPPPTMKVVVSRPLNHYF